MSDIRQKAKGYVLIARKAGYAILGADNLKGYSKKIYLVLADLQSGKNLLKIANSFEDKATVIYTQDVEQLVGVKNCKIVGIKNKGISERIIELLRSEEFGK
jgi:hypothetical protein